MRHGLPGVLGFALVLGACQPVAEREAGLPVERLRLPPGFAIETWAEVPNAHALALAPDGTRVYVGTSGHEVFAVLDPERDGRANEVVRIADGLDAPRGVAVGPAGTLFIAERRRVIKISPQGRVGVVVPQRVLPQTEDGWRQIAVGPDGRVYLGIGGRCIDCRPRGLRNSIIRVRPDGSEFEVFARGTNNPGGFAWDPLTGVMFFTDAPEPRSGEATAGGELNRAPRRGLHFGQLLLPARSPARRGLQARPSRQEPARPLLAFTPGLIPLGIEFYDGGMFPAAYREDAFVAQQPDPRSAGARGPAVMHVAFAGGAPQHKEVFLDGWTGAQGAAWGRPVDLEELPDGSLLVSDDLAGVIYRITYAAGPPPGADLAPRRRAR